MAVEEPNDAVRAVAIAKRREYAAIELAYYKAEEQGDDFLHLVSLTKAGFAVGAKGT